MTRLGIVVGLPQEAAILKEVLGASTPPICCAGSHPARAAAAARELIAGGAEILLSFGYAGGLDPSLQAGDIVIPDGVTAPDGASYSADAPLGNQLRTALPVTPCRVGIIAGVDRVLASVEDKRAVALRTGAVAVDMESHAVASSGYKFVVLRAIIDPADRALPTSVLKAVDDQGEVRPLTLIANLLHAPTDLSALLALWRDHAAARRSLRRAAAALAALT